MKSVRVRVPASTSNLGPGFDCLGLALGLYNDLILELHGGDFAASPAQDVVEIKGEGQDSLPKDGKNLMARAARRVLKGRRLVFKAVNRIPLARGLGSSAAAAVAGLYAANKLREAPLTDAELLDIACELEGHPDNAAASIHRGLVVSIKQQEGVRTYPLSVSKDLAAIVCIPDFELSTKKARAVLPAKISREDAVFNIGRALVLGAALERGQWDRLAQATQDRLHQPYRAKLVRGFNTVLRAAKNAGAKAAMLSGAGPTMLALCPKGSRAAAIGRAMQKAFLRHGVESRYLVLPVDREGVSFA